MTATPLKLNPPFPSSWVIVGNLKEKVPQNPKCCKIRSSLGKCTGKQPEFGEGVDSARGVAAMLFSVAIVHATARSGRRTIAWFLLFQVQFALQCFVCNSLREGFQACRLRGPVAILFISRDACSDSIAKILRACFCGVSHNYRARGLQNGVSHRCACVKLSTKGGYRTTLGGSANLPEKVSRDMRYRSDSIAISRDMGPLSMSRFWCTQVSNGVFMRTRQKLKCATLVWKRLFKTYAGSGLPQGPFLENNSFPLQVGLGWVFVNGLKWVQKWVKQ